MFVCDNEAEPNLVAFSTDDKHPNGERSARRTRPVLKIFNFDNYIYNRRRFPDKTIIPTSQQTLPASCHTVSASTYCRTRNYAEASTGSRQGRFLNARPARRALPLSADDAAHFISTTTSHTMPCARIDSKGPPSLLRRQAGRHQHRLIASSTASSALSPPAHAQPIIACAGSSCSAVISSSAEVGGLHNSMSS